MEAKFDLGQMVITSNALKTLYPPDVPLAIDRHVSGDWGNLDEEDRDANERSLTSGGRLFSAYVDRRNNKFWIITEADRSVTTVLLPEDY